MKILVPVDGSGPALDAVRHALQLRREGLQASFVLATVQEPTFLYEMILAPDIEVLERVSGEVGARLLESAEALFTAAGVPYECEIASGYAATALIEIAENYSCDAIVMGVRGMGSLRSALMGSVSQAVLHAATLPVTFVKHVQAEVHADADADVNK